MHELSICQALIDQVEIIAQDRNAAHVEKIVLHLGPLSGVEPRLLVQAYPLVSTGTIAQQAELVIEELPIQIRCEDCGAESNVQANKLICGVCGNWRTQLRSGDVLLLASIEMI